MDKDPHEVKARFVELLREEDGCQGWASALSYLPLEALLMSLRSGAPELIEAAKTDDADLRLRASTEALELAAADAGVVISEFDASRRRKAARYLLFFATLAAGDGTSKQ